MDQSFSNIRIQPDFLPYGSTSIKIQFTFAWSDPATPVRLMPGWDSLFPQSVTRTVLVVPYGLTARNFGRQYGLPVFRVMNMRMNFIFIKTL